MEITANNPQRKSWLHVEQGCDFPIQNIPFGVFITKDDIITIGTRIGEYAIDLGAFHQLGYFNGIPLTDDIFMQDSLNDFIADGRKTWRLVRNRIADVFDIENKTLQNNTKHKEVIIFDVNEVEMLLPIQVGDFTDFFSSKEHATNVAKIFKLQEEPLNNNWSHMPLGFHSRASSVVVSGTPIRRPLGQTQQVGQDKPVFGPAKCIDMELETAFVTTDVNQFGKPIHINEAKENIFGMVLLNDWSARDIQKQESKPLGPFLSKSFATTISAWIVTMDALEPFKCEGPEQENVVKYLKHKKNKNSYDIKLKTFVETPNGDINVLSESNFKNLYWTMTQQLTHHTINGCNVRAGDLIGSGTISGSTKNSYGSMLELTWNEEEPITLKDGSTRTYFKNGDHVIIRGYCENSQGRIGFGKCTGKILPAVKYNLPE